MNDNTQLEQPRITQPSGGIVCPGSGSIRHQLAESDQCFLEIR
jgi:hypothetical protein